MRHQQSGWPVAALVAAAVTFVILAGLTVWLLLSTPGQPGGVARPEGDSGVFATPQPPADEPSSGRAPVEPPDGAPTPRRRTRREAPSPPAPRSPQAPVSPPGSQIAPNPDTTTRNPDVAAAHQELEAGVRAEAAGEFQEALQHYQRVKALDPSLGGVADLSATRIRSQMTAIGTDAFRRATQYDALGRRDDAILWYERAIRNLPDGHPNRKIAMDRLSALRERR